jgi:hypothetical protein
VGVAVDRQPSGCCGDDGLQRAPEAFGCLLWQAVHEIYIDGVDSGLAARLHARERLLATLYAVDGSLNLDVKVLYPEAHPIDAETCQGREILRTHEARVDLDRDLAFVAVRKAEVPAQALDDLPNCAGVRKLGVPPPKCSCGTSL